MRRPDIELTDEAAAFVEQHPEMVERVAGHPRLAAGQRPDAHGLDGLPRRVQRQRWGLAAICIGVGQALAVVLENTEA